MTLHRTHFGQSQASLATMYNHTVHTCTVHVQRTSCIYTCFNERWEGRKKEASKVKQTNNTRQSNTAHPRQLLTCTCTWVLYMQLSPVTHTRTFVPQTIVSVQQLRVADVAILAVAGGPRIFHRTTQTQVEEPRNTLAQRWLGKVESLPRAVVRQQRKDNGVMFQYIHVPSCIVM